MFRYKNLKLRLRFFRENAEGSMPTEGVMAFAFLIWWYIASFQFFDAFRQKNVNLKAAYTIADMISRQTNAIDSTYINGLNTVFDYLTFSNHPTWIRVSSVFWDDTNKVYKVAWSQATGTHLPQTNATIQMQAGRIPTMPEGDTVVIVETYMAYEPIFSVGLEARWYDTFIPTRPRFAGCVPFKLPDGTTTGCNFSGS
jgi:hypothetical protein